AMKSLVPCDRWGLRIVAPCHMSTLSVPLLPRPAPPAAVAGAEVAAAAGAVVGAAASAAVAAGAEVGDVGAEAGPHAASSERSAPPPSARAISALRVTVMRALLRVARALRRGGACIRRCRADRCSGQVPPKRVSPHPLATNQ